MSREVTQTPDEVIVYPLTTRRLMRFYLLCLAVPIVGLPYIHFFVVAMNISVPLVLGLFFTVCFGIIHAVLVKCRQEKRLVRSRGIKVTSSITNKRRMRTGGAWGSVTMLAVQYESASGSVTAEHAVHPAIWQRVEIGQKFPIRVSPRNPTYWIAASDIDECELYEKWKNTSFKDSFAW